jgi:hypothetical protein
MKMTQLFRQRTSFAGYLSNNHIPRTNIFGHDFARGYSPPGGTSCHDRLFAAVHSQATIAAWVETNVGTTTAQRVLANIFGSTAWLLSFCEVPRISAH